MIKAIGHHIMQTITKGNRPPWLKELDILTQWEIFNEAAKAPPKSKREPADNELSVDQDADGVDENPLADVQNKSSFVPALVLIVSYSYR